MTQHSSRLPVGRGRGGREAQPFETLQQAVNRMFDDFGRGFFATPSRPADFDREPFNAIANAPAADLAEHDTEYELTLELPGMDAAEIDVKFANGVLTITGEKKQEKEEKKKDYFLSERRFGSFRRAFQVPEGVDTSAIEADFAKGVLTVRLPKSADAQGQEKKIDIKSG